MDLVILLLEPFLPEIAAKLAEKNTVSLCKRLFRSGLLLIVIGLVIVLYELFVHLVLLDLPLNQFDLIYSTMLSARLFGASGISLLLISH